MKGKAEAIERLKRGESSESISHDIGVSIAFIDEWNDALELDEPIEVVLNTRSNKSRTLKSALLDKAISLTSDISDENMSDDLVAAVDLICKLQTSFFPKSITKQ